MPRLRSEGQNTLKRVINNRQDDDGLGDGLTTIAGGDEEHIPDQQAQAAEEKKAGKSERFR